MLMAGVFCRISRLSRMWMVSLVFDVGACGNGLADL